MIIGSLVTISLLIHTISFVMMVRGCIRYRLLIHWYRATMVFMAIVIHVVTLLALLSYWLGW